MKLIRPCRTLPLCNFQMLVEDYSNAVYWRIAALFSTIAALFSAAVVLWFLLFRPNPNLPDDTDSSEKLRFLNNMDKEKHHLLAEIIRTIRSCPYRWPRLRPRGSTTPSFMQRLAYVFFGPSESGQRFDDLEQLDISDDETFLHDRKYLNPKSRFVNETSFKNMARNPQSDVNKNKTAYKKCINIKNTGTESKQGNRNNNNNNPDKNIKNQATKGIIQNKLFRYLAKPRKINKLNRLEIDDEILVELNKNFANLITVRFAEAVVLIKYAKSERTISVRLTSLSNLSSHDLESVGFLVDVFYKNKFRNRMTSSMPPLRLGPKEQKIVNFEFLVETNHGINLKMIKLNVLIVGKLSELKLTEPNSSNCVENDGLVLISDSASQIQILGGVTVKIKDYAQLFK